jgi:hypothetical protein
VLQRFLPKNKSGGEKLMKKNKNVLAVFSILFLLTIMPFLVTKAAAATYEPLRTPVVGDNEVNGLGEIFAQFTGGRLQKNDTVIFRLPEGFIWTTADIGSDKAAAAASHQTTEQWNATTFEDSYARYGTSNYILVPRTYAGNENGLYKESVPVLRLTRLNDREVMMKIVDDPVPFQDCYFYIYVERVFVASGYSGNVSLQIDASPGSGLAGENNVYNSIECQDTPEIYTGVPGQKIGPIVITEAAAGRIGSGQSLKLRLPEGAGWLKLAEDSDNNLEISGSVSTADDGRTAEFKFTGKSKSAASLTLTDMEVAVKPGTTGNLQITVSGTAGLAGELSAAKISPPAAVFTVGQTGFELNGDKKTMDVAPYIEDDRLYLPVRYFAQAAGISENNIIWSQSEQSIEIKKSGSVVKLKIGDELMYVDNTPTLMDAAPEIIAPGRTMLPLSWVAKALGFEVYWEPGAQQAYILSLNKN